MKKYFLLLIAIVIPFLFLEQADAADVEKVPVNVFVRDDCTHCKEEEAFLDELLKTRDDFEVIYYDIGEIENRNLFNQVVKKEGVPKATPVTVISKTVIQGYGHKDTTGALIESLLSACSDGHIYTLDEYISGECPESDIVQVDGQVCDEEAGICTTNVSPYLIHVPLIGTIDAQEYSIPTMSVILGFIDGFNPCAMWVLVTFLVVLVQIGNFKRMIQIAALFILAEAVMYYLILNVWFTTWDFIGLDKIVTPIIGIVAIGGGLFFLWEWWTSDGTCKVTNLKQKKRIHEKINSIAENPLTWLSALAVIGLALSVNVIEFACSIGIPQTFTKILELNQLSLWTGQGSVLLYILFYMIDDVLVFGLAIWGIEHLHLTAKYSKWSNFVGGILMLLLGYFMIFNPAVLRFM